MPDRSGQSVGRFSIYNSSSPNIPATIALPSALASSSGSPLLYSSPTPASDILALMTFAPSSREALSGNLGIASYSSAWDSVHTLEPGWLHYPRAGCGGVGWCGSGWTHFNSSLPDSSGESGLMGEATLLERLPGRNAHMHV